MILKKITPVRLLKNFSDLYAYSFWKICRPVRLLQTVRLLETLEYHFALKCIVLEILLKFILVL